MLIEDSAFKTSAMDWAFVSQFILMLFSWIRVGLFVLLIFLNGNTLRKTILTGFGSYRCIHKLFTGVLCLVNLLYLCTWIPFIAYGITNGYTMIVDSTTYCFQQYFITNILGVGLLSVAGLRILEAIRVSVFSMKPFSSSLAANVLLVTWFLPLFAFDILWPFKDQVGFEMAGSFHFIKRVTDLNLFCTEKRKAVFGVGFLICKERLSPERVQELFYQYLFLIFPPGLFCFICVQVWLFHLWRMRKRQTFTKNCCSAKIDYQDSLNFKIPCSSICQSFMATIDVVLAINMLWQVFIRPLMVLHVVYSAVDRNSPMVFVDLGSHLVFTISSVFAPMLLKYSEILTTTNNIFTLSNKEMLNSPQKKKIYQI